MKKQIRLDLNEFVDGVLSGHRVVLAKAITLVESSLSSDQELAEQLINELLPFTGNSIRIGITGVPGVGKSTFIESFGGLLLQKGKKIAVLAVDASSQKTGGSILGDKTRMEKLSTDKRAFVRPSPAGSTLGGVGAKTREAMLLCEAAGYDIVMVETVGVGQSEIAVRGMVDFFLLLMLSGAGDELQGIKKGIIEICDALVITKADGDLLEKAKIAENVYANALQLLPREEGDWVPEVRICSALQSQGLLEIWEMITSFLNKMKSSGAFDTNRAQQRLNWFQEHIRNLLEKGFYEHQDIAKELSEKMPLIKNGVLAPNYLAKTLVKRFLNQFPG